mmetsp:Transcript_18278/g.47000  ORF Transcript_18278/g.47000 Transcript_18278/m.47000 type:complete len:167 (-) Transcript_18278:9-509(-)|eukprot:6602494-Prymnesium_polylepis.2
MSWPDDVACLIPIRCECQADFNRLNGRSPLHAELSVEHGLCLLGFDEQHLKPALRACAKAGCNRFGSLVGLAPADFAGLRLRKRHKNELRRAVLSWKCANVAPLSASQLRVLRKLCAGGPSLTAESVASAWLSTCALPIAEAFSFEYCSRKGVAMLSLESTHDEEH